MCTWHLYDLVWCVWHKLLFSLQGKKTPPKLHRKRWKNELKLTPKPYGFFCFCFCEEEVSHKYLARRSFIFLALFALFFFFCRKTRPVTASSSSSSSSCATTQPTTKPAAAFPQPSERTVLYSSHPHGHLYAAAATTTTALAPRMSAYASMDGYISSYMDIYR